MKTKVRLCLLFLCLVQAAGTFAQEKKIDRSALPRAVEKTVEEQSKGATIRSFSQEKEHGQISYEAAMLVNGHTKDVQIDANGAVLEIEEQVDLHALPANVRAGLQAKAGKGKITKVESITKKDKLVAYEAKVVTDGKKSEVQVGPDGKPLAHEE
jgi:uncharacterized membrane protein YkoI